MRKRLLRFSVEVNKMQVFFGHFTISPLLGPTKCHSEYTLSIASGHFDSLFSCFLTAMSIESRFVSQWIAYLHQSQCFRHNAKCVEIPKCLFPSNNENEKSFSHLVWTHMQQLNISWSCNHCFRIASHLNASNAFRFIFNNHRMHHLFAIVFLSPAFFPTCIYFLLDTNHIMNVYNYKTIL